MNGLGQPDGEKGWNRIAYLAVLAGPGSKKGVVVGKCLNASGFTDCEASTLSWIRVDEVMAVLGDMGRHSCGRTIPCLHSKTI